MAKAKKKETLTLEEKLERALVPIEEQPYEIPENWCWVKIGKLTEVQSGGTPSTSHEEYYENGDIPWISPADLSGYNNKYIQYGNKRITQLGLEKSSARLLPKNTVCLSSRAPIGYVVIAENELCTNQGFKNFLPSDGYLPEYLYWYLKENKDMLESKASGTTFLELSGSKAAQVEFPLAPLAEQQRIVEQIEKLFFKLDEAKEKAQTTIDMAKDRRNAIYAKAFNGRLTLKWREQNDVSMDGWKTMVSQDACEPINCGKTPKEFITEEGEIPYLKVYNIVNNKIDFATTPQYIPREIHEGKLKSSILKSHDIIMNIVGPPLRKIAIIPDDYPEWNMNQAIVRFRPKKEIMDYRFLYYTLLNPETLEEVIAQTRGVVGQANISVSQSRNLIFICPSLEEQKEIVKILDSLFEKEDVAVELSKQIIDSIDSMKKSILADAFRGKLGTNDKNDTPSIQLLKKIIEGES